MRNRIIKDSPISTFNVYCHIYIRNIEKLISIYNTLLCKLVHRIFGNIIYLSIRNVSRVIRKKVSIYRTNSENISLLQMDNEHVLHILCHKYFLMF